MGYSIGIILLVANLVVIGAGYGYSAPSAGYGASAAYGPNDNSKDYAAPEPAVIETEPETAEVVVEPTNSGVKENGPAEVPASPFNSYASAYNQGYEQGYAYGQGQAAPQPPVAPSVAVPSAPTPIVNAAMYAGHYNAFNAPGPVAPSFESSFDVRGPQFHQGQMLHQGQPMPVMPSLSMRPMNPTSFSPNNRRPIITSGPGLMVMTSPSAGVVPLSENDHDIPPNMIFGIGNRKPVRPVFSLSSNTPRPSRFGFSFTSGQSSAPPTVFNKFNGFGSTNTFPFSTSNHRNQAFGNNRFSNQFNNQFSNQFSNHFNNQAFSNNRNRRSAMWTEYPDTQFPTRFW